MHSYTTSGQNEIMIFVILRDLMIMTLLETRDENEDKDKIVCQNMKIQIEKMKLILIDTIFFETLKNE